MLSTTVALWGVGLLSVAFAVNEKLPDSVGVPMISPVDSTSVSPGGSAPLAIDQL
jgi:hypothetical protein